MSTRWASGSVAGVALQDAGGRDCRVDVLDGETLKGIYIGDSVLALDLSVHTQIINRGVKGAHFGIHVAQIPIDKVDDIIAAMETAIGAGNSFTVTLADEAGIDDFTVLCVPDYAALGGRPYQRGGMAAGYVKEAIFRFISTG